MLKNNRKPRTPLPDLLDPKVPGMKYEKGNFYPDFSYLGPVETHIPILNHLLSLVVRPRPVGAQSVYEAMLAQKNTQSYMEPALNAVFKKQGSVLEDLKNAKEHSDNRAYAKKAEIMRKVLVANAKDFEYWITKNIVALTHVPTGFKLHLLKKDIPAEIYRHAKMSKNA